MKMTFRWYGDSDPVTLDNIRQIPNMTGVVSAIYDIPVGEVWPYEKIMELKKRNTKEMVILKKRIELRKITTIFVLCVVLICAIVLLAIHLDNSPSLNNNQTPLL